MATSKFKMTHVACILFSLGCADSGVSYLQCLWHGLTIDNRHGHSEAAVLVEHTVPVGRMGNKPTQINNKKINT